MRYLVIEWDPTADVPTFYGTDDGDAASALASILQRDSRVFVVDTLDPLRVNSADEVLRVLAKKPPSIAET